MSETHEGYFLIADITGYTRYLSESKLEHAQDTLTALLELLVEKTRLALVISGLAGDAVISYGLRESRDARFYVSTNGDSDSLAGTAERVREVEIWEGSAGQ